MLIVHTSLCVSVNDKNIHDQKSKVEEISQVFVNSWKGKSDILSGKRRFSATVKQVLSFAQIYLFNIGLNFPGLETVMPAAALAQPL